MAHRKCTICGKEIVLMPPASERAKKDKAGNSAQFYLDLFPEHGRCVVAKRSQESLDLMARLRHARAH